MNTAIIRCNECKFEWKCEFEYASDINWLCSKCNSMENSYLISLSNDENNDDNIILGRGGRGKPRG